MKACRVSITTVADGKETKFEYDGKLHAENNAFQVRYFEPQAEVLLSVSEKGAQLQRSGDYSLQLLFRNGELMSGSIGISGSIGNVQTHTRHFAYKCREKSVSLSLKYDLILSGEKQIMEILLFAKEICRN